MKENRIMSHMEMTIEEKEAYTELKEMLVEESWAIEGGEWGAAASASAEGDRNVGEGLRGTQIPQTEARGSHKSAL